MRRLLLILLLASPCCGALTNVQTPVACTTNASVNTLTCTITASAAHSIIAVGLATTASETISSVTDSASNTYTNASCDASDGAGRGTHIWYFKDSGSGITTVTGTWSATSTNRKEMYVHEIGGANNTTPLDGTCQVANSIAAATPSNGAAITTTNANDYVFSLFRCSGTADGVNSPFTKGAGSNAGESMYDIVSSTGTYTPAVTESLTGTGASSTIAFAQASSSVGPNVGFKGKVGFIGKVGVK